MSLKSLAQGRTDILKIDPRAIHIKDGWNSRDFNDPDNIEAVNVIARSIAEIGFKHNKPLTVSFEDGKCWLVNGETRLRAAKQAISNGVDLKAIPVVPAERFANEADRIFDQSLDNSGRPFKDLEQARCWKRLIDLGWQQGDIAKRAGISASRVSQILGLLRLPEPVKAMVVAGNVSATMAQQTVASEGTAAEKVLKDGLAKAQAEGKTKVTAAHVEGTTRQPNIRTAVIDAFEYSDVNDDADDVVVIKMPLDKWEVLKSVLKL